MHFKHHRILILTSVISSVCLLLALSRYFTHPVDASSFPVQYVALIGSESDIDASMVSMISSGELRSLRDYRHPHEFLDEAPISFFTPGTEPTDLIIRLYQLSVPPSLITPTKDNVYQAVQPVSSTVKVSFDELQFLTFAPNQIVVHGICDVMADLHLGVSGLTPLSSIAITYSQANDTPCINLYHVSGSMVDVKIADINSMVGTPNPPSFYPDYWAERNYLLSGAMGGVGSFGSGGEIIADAPAPTPFASPLSTTGYNVEVKVFDTSPYEFTTPEFITDIGSKSIAVRHDFPESYPLPERNPTIDAHGTLVTSRILELAPDADILLQRVLDKHGIGTGFTFYQAVDDAAKQIVSTTNFDADGVIFNYSLSLDVETNYEQTAIYRLLGEIDQLNIIQVAASGNNSAYAAVPQPMTMPAAHPRVIGVAAVAGTGMITCYSNVGDVAVPGGGAPRGAGNCDMDEMVEACKSGLHTDCAIGWDPTSATNWAWSVGSSFSAPIVTGFVAQIVELIATNRPRTAETAPQNFVSFDAVLEEMTAHTQASGGEAGLGNLFVTLPVTAIQGYQGVADVDRGEILFLLIPLLILVISSSFLIRSLRK